MHGDHSIMDSKKSQLERFKEAARKVEADTSDDALDSVFGKLSLAKKDAPDDSDKKQKGKTDE
tara:strand:- start:17 stop:205 length:189 start_codon:yes stop_codon:yes gene_type:complete